MIWASGSDYYVTPFPARYGVWASVARQPLLGVYGDTPYGTDGYYGQHAVDRTRVSHHVMTTGGILGRDRVTTGTISPAAVIACVPPPRGEGSRVPSVGVVRPQLGPLRMRLATPTVNVSIETVSSGLLSLRIVANTSTLVSLLRKG